jgi:tetratricopeptide (TPR) repeat protein
MFKHFAIIALVLVYAAPVFADYIADRKAAAVQMKAKKYQEAMDAFVKLAEATDNKNQKTDAYEQAAMCAFRLKDNAKAVELAKEIPDVEMSKVVQMRFYPAAKRADLIAAYKDEDFSKWQERTAGEAFFIRGNCYFSTKKGKEAESDLINAMANLGDGEMRNQARLILAHNYNQVLKDKEKALETYRQGIKTGPRRFGWISLTSLTSSVAILREQGKVDEALALLKSAKVDQARAYWGAAIQQSYGEIYFKQGKKAEAIAKMKQAIETKGIGAWQKTKLEKRLAAMQDAK